MINKNLAVAALAALASTVALSGGAQAQGRDQIRVVGSSTVFPFTSAVAETFGRMGKFKTPVVESTGTGGGIKQFCAGVGVQHPDLTNASRRIKKSELEGCAANGVTTVSELEVGFDGIVIANSKSTAHADFTIKQIFQALAKQVVVNGQVVPNPHKTWKDIDPSLPAAEIEVLGPPPTSGTRDAFVELVMDVGCAQFPEIKALPADQQKAVCNQIREDGAFIEAGENDNLIVQKLVANKDAFGIFGYSFLDQNMDKLQGAKMNGVAPDLDTIASAKYPVARSMYVYVKNQHVDVIPGIREFLAEYTSEKAFGEEGYLEAKGLIPLPKDKREKVRTSILNLTPVTM
ncbi:phosphate ABC transporter substrate-binding protein [Skermanella stibiiresistens SB22]|uniref:Phosphate ABC transporter substrate-binding protein n=1 Tax=Skermanella stibiiresistens SB22 TaxID=1385369 RepID=W9GXW9_9PROT|nr:PstS family phosphate ABC transporter substrate-binding protein [Skermanella stibiiresistens]EWY37292.1 phosphate ABC transporter substrate-binding protein [Skermanella stibiiresistens SB22]